MRICWEKFIVENIFYEEINVGVVGKNLGNKFLCWGENLFEKILGLFWEINVGVDRKNLGNKFLCWEKLFTL
jgi:hypothetical protein